jgi:A nuclease family of the HNH/ENDO VII superfamily with conserved AHH
MAANINLHQPRVDYAHAERDDENSQGEGTTADSQTPAQLDASVSAPTEQQGQSGDGAGGDTGTQDTSTPPPPRAEPNAPKPNFARYGVGDTVITGRPDYGRAYALSSNRFEPPEPAERTPATDAKPLTKPGSESPSPVKPIPMPKPGSGMSPTTISAPLEAPITLPSATTNAPCVGGEAVRQALAADQRNSQNVQGKPAASASELEVIDAMLADPLNKQLIDLAKQKMEPAPINDAVADAQIKLYGEARFQDMMYLHRALPWVQDAYAQAVKEAYLASTQPALTANLTNNQGIATPPSTFDINAFNKEYESRPDLMAQAFAAKFGGVPVTQEMVISGTFASGDGGGDMSGAYVPVFNVGNLFSVSMNAVFPTGYADGQEASPPTYSASRTPNTIQQYVLGPDIGDHRAMFDDTAVWFDPSMGFVTDPRNMKDDEDSHFDRIMGIVGPIVLTGILAAAGAQFLIGPQGSAVYGFAADSWQAGAIRGGVQGAVGTVVNSAVTGRPFTLADLGRSIFSGGVMGGLVNYAQLDTYGITTQNGAQVTNWGERLTAILGRSTMQGILQQVTGGRFQDGLRNGLLSSLTNELSRTLNTEINRWAAENNVDPFVASRLRMVGQGFASALVQTAANGGQVGLEAFLNDLINGSISAAGDAERAEINQLTTQYTSAVATNDYTTQATILNELTERWMNNHTGDTRAQALAQVTAGLGWTVDAVHLTQEANGRVTAEIGTIKPTFDEEGNLMPGVVTPNDPPGNQRRQIEAHLVQQGYSATDARQIAEGWYVNRVADVLQASDRTLSRDAALNQARAALTFNDPNPIVIDVTTRAHVPGQEIAEQFLGALVGTGGVAVDVLKGTVDLLAMSADGYAQIANVLTGGELFPDVGRRNEARSEILNQLANNWDKLPGAMVDQFNAQLERANQLDVQDTPASRFEAAQIRSHVFGSVALAVLTLGETAVVSGSRVISTLADARAAVGEIVSSGPLRGGMAAQSGAIDVVAMLDGGRILIRNGSEFIEAIFVDGRRLVYLRPATELIDDAMLLRLRNGEQITNPADITRIERSMQIREAFVNADGTWTRKPGDVSKPEYYLEVALRAEGKEPPGTRGDYTPHHLTMFDADMAETQQLLSRYGINPNDAANGVWLERSYHQTLHTDAYRLWVRDQILDGSINGGREGVLRALREIAEHLRQHKPIPGR